MSDETEKTSPAADVHETGVAIVGEPVIITDMPGLDMTAEEIMAAARAANAGAAPVDPRDTEILMLRMQCDALNGRIEAVVRRLYALDARFENPRA